MPLPESPSFLVSDALKHGATRSILRSRSLEAPFHGVRARTGTLFDLECLCAAYALKMPLTSAFTGITAARLWQFPLPAYLPAQVGTVDVAALAPRRAARGARVCGSKYTSGIARRVVLDGLPVLTPADTWCTLAAVLDVPDLAAVADHLLSDGPGRRPARADLRELGTAVQLRARQRGSRALRDALALARPHCWSRTETLTRIVLMSAGIPEPELNHRLTIGRREVRLDLAWPEARFGLEYDGDHHRDSANFAADIRRQELVQDVGWSLMRATRDDLFRDPKALVLRVASRLARHGIPSPLEVSQMVRPRP